MELPCPLPHPLAWWHNAPGIVVEALEWVVGVEWPEGNEKTVWDLADHWYRTSDVLLPTVDQTVAGGHTAAAGFGGSGTELGAAIDQAWLDIAGRPDSDLQTLIQLCLDVGELVEACGRDIQAAKIEMYIELGIMAIELIATLGAAIVTLGAASAAAPAVAALARWSIQQIFKRLLHKLLSTAVRSGAQEAVERVMRKAAEKRLARFALGTGRHAFEEGLEEFGTDVATQNYQINHGRRDGYDTTSLLLSTSGGAAGGAFGGLAHLGPHAESGLTRFGQHMVRGAVGEALAETGAGIVTGQGLPDGDNLARSLTSGGVSGSLDGTRASLADKRADLLAQRVAGFDGHSPVDLTALAGPSTGPLTALSDAAGVGGPGAASDGGDPGTGQNGAVTSGSTGSTVDGATDRSGVGGAADLAGATLAPEAPVSTGHGQGPVSTGHGQGPVSTSGLPGPADPGPPAGRSVLSGQSPGGPGVGPGVGGPGVGGPGVGGPGISGPGISGPGVGGPVLSSPASAALPAAIPPPASPTGPGAATPVPGPSPTVPPAAAPGTAPPHGRPVAAATNPLTARRSTGDPTGYLDPPAPSPGPGPGRRAAPERARPADPRPVRERMLDPYDPSADLAGPAPDTPHPTGRVQPWNEWKAEQGAAWRDQAVSRIADEFGLADDPSAVAAIADGYTLTRDHIAPFVTQIAAEMLAGFRADVAADPSHRVVFVGRDGAALGLAVQGLDPEFFADHGTEVTLPRRLAMLPVAEQQGGLAVAEPRQLLPAEFRWEFDGAPPNVVGTKRELDQYLRAQGVPIRTGAVTLVDSSFKGTVQEMLAALYPQVRFQGCYIWHEPHPDDPHPATKTGFALHLPVGPNDNAAKLKWEIRVYEDTLRGPLSSPSRFADGRPVQGPESESNPNSRIQATLIADRYRNTDPTNTGPPDPGPPAVPASSPDPRTRLRDAVLMANQSAVLDYARHIAGEPDPAAELYAGYAAYRQETWRWYHLRMVHPIDMPDRYVEFLDSFARGGPGGPYRRRRRGAPRSGEP